ncbi:hypothetical protein E2C01_066341 [Portunus trituberculatus]|uniref:Uncharacterized protein n=1 Tax=Portunus trituberculatus TaxID=210409 RepID=A0A5B7HTK6_PORTR|nr:hypothetical protein [Portunus trituberculatus]
MLLFPPTPPCLASPCLALPCLALPCLALLCLALPCLASPCLAVPLLILTASLEIAAGRSLFPFTFLQIAGISPTHSSEDAPLSHALSARHNTTTSARHLTPRPLSLISDRPGWSLR